MDKSNLELFKQALNEGISNKFDIMAAGCTEEIVYSERHKLAMRAIVYGKTDTKRVWSPKMKRIIAILITAALLLTSCGIIFRNEIRNIIESVFESYIELTYSENGTKGEVIEESYELTYVPDGYELKETIVQPVMIKKLFVDKNDNNFWFEQRIIDGTIFNTDNEIKYTIITELDEYNIYYKANQEQHHYLWNDGKYVLHIICTTELTYNDIEKIINGIDSK